MENAETQPMILKQPVAEGKNIVRSPGQQVTFYIGVIESIETKFFDTDML